MTELTCDAALHGKVILYQPVRGYRFALDALLLADFASPASSQGHLVDLAVAVAWWGSCSPRCTWLRVTLVSCSHASRRSLVVTWTKTGSMRGSWCSRWTCGGFGTCCPGRASRPWSRTRRSPRRAGAGSRVIRSVAWRWRSVRLLARHRRGQRRLLLPGGLVSLVYPAERTAEVLAALLQAKLAPCDCERCTRCPSGPRAGCSCRRVKRVRVVW